MGEGTLSQIFALVEMAVGDGQVAAALEAVGGQNLCQALDGLLLRQLNSNVRD